MNLEDNFEFTPGEIHCYFPEWADRPESAATVSESDRNSYMAGGYAEEFGYRSYLESPAVFTILDGDPERCSLWRVQMGGLHPGYPECARPLDRIRSEGELAAPPQHPAQDLRSDRAEVRFTAVRVRRNLRADGSLVASWWKSLRILSKGMSKSV